MKMSGFVLICLCVAMSVTFGWMTWHYICLKEEGPAASFLLLLTVSAALTMVAIRLRHW